MNKLFSKIIIETKQLVKLYELAPSKLSDYGIKHSEPSTQQLNRWNAFVDESKKQCIALDSAINSKQKDIDTIHMHLAYFMQLSKRMDYGDPGYWSEYNSLFENKLNDVVEIIAKIYEQHSIRR